MSEIAVVIYYWVLMICRLTASTPCILPLLLNTAKAQSALELLVPRVCDGQGTRDETIDKDKETLLLIVNLKMIQTK